MSGEGDDRPGSLQNLQKNPREPYFLRRPYDHADLELKHNPQIPDLLCFGDIVRVYADAGRSDVDDPRH
ncbi:hypothetical protein, partial [Alkalibacillus haloalkaliphilus]|uniref:hypothetical protein n=1 Tax=Alkalibacillus haloalkaliphilus TaxID=94136 RepID=UPI002935FC8F